MGLPSRRTRFSTSLARLALLALGVWALVPVHVASARGAIPTSAPSATSQQAANTAPSSPPSAASSIVTHDGFTYAHRPVETIDAIAQFDFDRGLTLLYAFDPGAARKSFEAAAQRDPALAMAQWGIALSHGPNINTDFDSAEQREGRVAITRARTLEANATPVDRELIEAAVTRYTSDRTNDADRVAQTYREAMARVANDFPNDDDVQVLAAEAALDAHPWEYFNEDGSAKPWTPAIIERLESVLARDPMHIGANHYLIHADEESGKPDSAAVAARALFAMHFEPAAEHLEHMPAHIFMQIGDYHDAGVANERAVDDFLRYRANDDGTESAHESYFGHDCSFGVQALATAGEHERASALATRCGAGRFAVIADLRFGRYAQAHRDDPMHDGAAGLAALANGDLDEAARHVAKLKGADSPASVITRQILQAKIASARGDQMNAITLLEAAVKAEDALGYSEPPRYYYPVRETLGAEYLRAKDYAAAERIFRADLAKNRENPRSLCGLAAALAGEGKTDDAAAAKHRFEIAWQHADVTLDPETL